MNKQTESNEFTRRDVGFLALIIVFITILVAILVNIDILRNFFAGHRPGETYFWEEVVVYDLSPEGKVKISKDDYPSWCGYTYSEFWTNWFVFSLNQDGSILIEETRTKFESQELFSHYLTISYSELSGAILGTRGFEELEIVNGGIQKEVRLYCTVRWFP